MSRASRAVMLAALSLGVLLVGIELFITAVALPDIFFDISGWSELRRASWIVTAYLVAYIAAMPLAGRAADRFGLPGLMIAALLLFGTGSLICGAAPSLEVLVLGRVVQGAGAGAILPVATAGASHLYTGHARSRALGLVGGATFLGMAVGPLLGALILEQLQLRDALAGIGIWGGPVMDLATPAWRWVFYVTAPLALLAAIYVWAAEPGWDVAPGSSRMDALGAVLFSLALTSGLLAITLIGDEPGELPVIPVAAGIALVTGSLAIVRMLRVSEPFLDLRLFADRVRFAGPDEQGLVLGPMAFFMAVGAFVSGFLMRRLDATAVTIAGLLGSVVGLVWLSTTRIDTALWVPIVALSLFGLGFGLTVTPRSMAAVEAAGRDAFGAASAAVTVARMGGMAVGMAVLTAFGTTRIDQTTLALEDQAYRDAILPPELVGQPLGDPLVLDAIERWASSEAALVLGQLFVVAAIVLVVAIVPAWAMREGRGGAGEREGHAPEEELTVGF